MLVGYPLGSKSGEQSFDLGGCRDANRQSVRTRCHVPRRTHGRPDRSAIHRPPGHPGDRRAFRRRYLASARCQVRSPGHQADRLSTARRLPAASGLGRRSAVDLKVADVGDVEMPSGDTELSLRRLEEAVYTVCAAGAIPVILGGDHTVTFPDATGVARQVGWGRVSLIHFDAHADTGDTQFGSLYGHGTPMRRLIESGAVRGDRFLQLGLRGYWPEPADFGLDGSPADAQLRDDGACS